MLHDCIHTARLTRSDGDSDAPDDPGGESVGEPFPRIATVERAKETAPRASTHEAEALPLPLIERGVQRAAVGVDGYVHRTRDIVAGQHLLPRFPAVPRAIYSTLGVRPPQMT